MVKTGESFVVSLQILVQCPCLGCPLVSFKKKIATHAEFCEHRVFTCPMQKYKYDEECGWTGMVYRILLFLLNRIKLGIWRVIFKLCKYLWFKNMFWIRLALKISVEWFIYYVFSRYCNEIEFIRLYVVILNHK